ncbi:Shr3 amino acid permease chaperone [Chiua virens]|nr:Shr3 amino acid permease chaperone [Chiua virens]
MAVRASIVVCVTSFLLGSLFTHWIADSLTLWKSPITDEHLWTAASYYSILTKGPVQVLYVLLAIAALGGTTIFWSFRDGEAGNLMFDGGSIFLYGITVILYMHSVLPSLCEKFTSIPIHTAKDAFPRALRSPTLDLASNHLVCSVALTGVLILQAGRWWAELSDGDDTPYLEEKDTAESRQTKAAPVVSSGVPQDQH